MTKIESILAVFRKDPARMLISAEVVRALGPCNRADVTTVLRGMWRAGTLGRTELAAAGSRCRYIYRLAEAVE